MPKILNKTYAKGDYIFKENETGNLAFVIKQGSVNIVKGTDANEAVLASIGQGAMFGEMALINDKPRMASARAAEDKTTLIIISHELFDKKLNNTDPFIRGVLDVLSEQLRHVS